MHKSPRYKKAIARMSSDATFATSKYDNKYTITNGEVIPMFSQNFVLPSGMVYRACKFICHTIKRVDVVVVDPDLLAAMFWASSSQKDESSVPLIERGHLSKNMKVQDNSVETYVKLKPNAWPQMLLKEKTVFLPIFVDARWIAVCLWYSSLHDKFYVRVYVPKCSKLVKPRSGKFHALLM